MKTNHYNIHPGLSINRTEKMIYSYTNGGMTKSGFMKVVLVSLLLLVVVHGFSQNSEIEKFRDSLYSAAQRFQISTLFKSYTDSLHHVVGSSTNDSIRTWALVELSNNYKYRKPDSAVFYAKKAISMARISNLHVAEQSALAYYILTESAIGNNAKAFQLSLQKIKLAERHHLPDARATGVLLLGWSYGQAKKFEDAIANYQTALTYFNSINNETMGSIACAYMGDAYSNLNQVDSAIRYCQLAKSFTNRANWTVPFITLHLGNVYAKIDNTQEALKNYHQAKRTAGFIEAYWGIEATRGIALMHKKNHQLDSALYYGFDMLHLAQQFGFYGNIIEANLFLYEFYKNSNAQRALFFSETASHYKDSLSRMERLMAIEDFVTIDESSRQQELEIAKREYESQLKLNALLGSSFTLLVVAFVLYRSQRQKQKAKKKIERAFSQLKSAQSQLVQSEKMASLGELTAGIAHEIQNPLNFVNNFSEVNTELIRDLKSEIEKGNISEVKTIINNIESNSEKINDHGKRADGIVKSMLQHSRTSAGQKELTDVNALCEEYLRLSYHGYRAKDKSFNAKFETDFDPTLPKINVVPQDIGRVILNLINNAFYAVNEIKNQTDGKPTVSVSTKNLSDKIEIRVRDNGPGIPDSIKEKIFHPFFTTKPVGKGTGLGLSLTYDIVTKGHGGELNVKTKAGEGTEFIIQLRV